MKKKILKIQCQTLVTRMEYCMENYRMREAIKRVREFSQFERKLQAVHFMYEIYLNRIKLESLIQWVKVVYSDLLINSQCKEKDSSNVIICLSSPENSALKNEIESDEKNNDKSPIALYKNTNLNQNDDLVTQMN